MTERASLRRASPMASEQVCAARAPDAPRRIVFSSTHPAAPDVWESQPTAFWPATCACRTDPVATSKCAQWEPSLRLLVPRRLHAQRMIHGAPKRIASALPPRRGAIRIVSASSSASTPLASPLSTRLASATRAQGSSPSVKGCPRSPQGRSRLCQQRYHTPKLQPLLLQCQRMSSKPQHRPQPQPRLRQQPSQQQPSQQQPNQQLPSQQQPSQQLLPQPQSTTITTATYRLDT